MPVLPDISFLFCFGAVNLDKSTLNRYHCALFWKLYLSVTSSIILCFINVLPNAIAVSVSVANPRLIMALTAAEPTKLKY